MERNGKATVFCVVVLVLQTAAASVVTVGDSLGWTNFDLSTQRVPDYAAWAASQPVHSGDSVVFRFIPGFHNVVSLSSKADFDECNMSKATTLNNGSSGNFTWNAPRKAGVYYFACGYAVEGQGTHCDGGQKVSITVIAAGTPTATPVQAPALAPAPSSAPAGSPSSSPLAASTPTASSVPVTSPSSQGNVPASPVSPGGHGSASAQTPGAAANDKSAAWCDVLNPWRGVFTVVTVALITGL